MSALTDPVAIDDALAAAWPLPSHDDDDDKEARGRVLVVGGSTSLGGAVVLAGVAALRAGAGKVAIGTSSAIAPLLAVAFPEARVVPLAENANGGLEASDALFAKPVDAVLAGPGMEDVDAACTLVREALRRSGEAIVVLDALAMDVLKRGAQTVGDTAGRIVVTPHAGELAHLTGRDKDVIAANPVESAREQSRAWGVVVVLKGARTVVAAPDGRTWLHDGGNVGLAVSGSGDTLAGIVAGLAARGASIEQAAAWGVLLHARAGDVLASRVGRLGFLAREIPAEIPALLERLGVRKPGAVGFRLGD